MEQIKSQSNQPDNNKQAPANLISQNQLVLSRPVPPTLLRIYADNQDKRSLCIFWTVFFVIIVLITALSAALPTQLLILNNKAQLQDSELQGCSNPAQFVKDELICSGNQTNSIGTMLLNFQNKNQFAVVFVNLNLHNPEKAPEFTFTSTVKLVQVQQKYRNNDQKYFKRVSQVDDQNVQIKLHSKQALELYASDYKTLIGYSYPIWFVRQFQGDFVIIIQSQDSLISLENVQSVDTQILTVNQEFTVYTIVIRYFFFTWSIVGFVLYFLRYRKIPISERIVEQKMVFALSILLIFFNDPIYPATVLTGSKFCAYLSVFFVTNFISFLITLWIVFIDRIFFQDGQKKSELVYWKRVLYFIVLDVLMIALYTEYAFDNLQDLPVVPAQDLASQKFIGLEVVVIILAIGGFIYIFVQYVRTCTSVDQKLWRNQLYMFFTLFFLFTTLVMFIVNGFSVFSYEGNRILLLYTQMNMFTFYMQYMYSITSQQKQKVKKGQYGQSRNDNYGLLEVQNDKDFIDLEFDDLPKSNTKKQQLMTMQEKSWGQSFSEQNSRENKVSTANKMMKQDSDQEEQKKQSIDFFKVKEERQENQQQKKQKQKKGEAINKPPKDDDDFGDFDLE